MVVFKYCNLPFSPPPTRGRGKEDGGGVDLVRNGSLEQVPSVQSGDWQFRPQVGSGSSTYWQTLHGYASCPGQQSRIANTNEQR